MKVKTPKGIEILNMSNDTDNKSESGCVRDKNDKTAAKENPASAPAKNCNGSLFMERKRISPNENSAPKICN